MTKHWRGRRIKKSEAEKLPMFHLASGGAPPSGAYVALVPGAGVPVLSLDIPPGLKGLTRERVARRQMADLFGRANLDFEMRPMALAGRKTPWNRALVVDHEERQKWVQGLPDNCHAVLPDYMALLWAPGIWTIETADGQIRARLAEDDGFTAEPELALALLEAAISQGTPRGVLLLGLCDPVVANLLKDNKLETATDAAKYGAKIFAHGEMALDLARDPGAEKDDMRRALRPFLLPAAMAVLALGLWAGAVIYETGDLRAQALAHRKGAEQILRDTMIPTGPILDMRAQVSMLVGKRRGAAELAAAKARPVDVFRTAGDVLADRETYVETVTYQATSGLVIDLKVSDFAALDQLVAALRGAGIELSVAQSTAREDEGVEVSLALASDRGLDQ